jgi:glycosyltransferase involved in cell wall biosynthesis
MRKLIFVSVHPIHYNDFLFSEVEKSGVDITVYYANKILNNYPWKEKLNYVFAYRNCEYNAGIDWRLLSKAIFSRNTTFVVAGWDSFFKNVLLFALVVFGKRYVISTDTVKLHVQRTGIKSALRAFWLKIILGNAYKIFTTGKIGVAAMEELYGKPTNKIVNFPFATDLRYFNTKPDFAGFAGKKILFSSGRLLNSHKGHDVAIKALQLLKNKGYHFHYSIAGTGPDEQMLKSLVSQLGMEDEVQFLGWQEMESVKKMYAGAHIFLHPAHFDPFPNAVLEAMASSLIVVASDTSGSAVERIDPDVSGFIFKDNDINGLSAAIETIFNFDMEHLLAISTAANEVSKRWDVTRNIAEVSAIL